MALSVGAYLLGTSASLAAGTLVGGAYFAAYAVGYLATTAVTSILMKALAPKPSSGGNRGYTVNSSGLLCCRSWS